tara:strand:- start:21347 stop:22993 length:1647 start_codon:yes stop_codon:yes gene_type:complete
MAIAESFLYLFQADTSSLIKGEKEAEEQNKKLDAGLKATDKTANTIAGSFGTLIATAGGALTALLSFAALSKGISQTSDYIDNLAKTAEMYGENVNALASYQEVVVKAGGSVSGFQGIVKSLNGSFNEFVTTGNTGILPYMQRLGISMIDSNGKAKSVLDTLPELADAFSHMSKEESAGIGQKLGLDEATIRLLQEGRIEVEKQVSAQKKLFSITKEQSDIFQKFNDRVSDSKTAFRGLFVTLGAEILPVVGYLLSKLQDGVQLMTKHKDLMNGIFIGLGVAITAYALPAMISFAIVSVTAFAPFYLIGAVVAGLIVTFGILYEDIAAFLNGSSSAFGDLLKWLGFSNEEIQAIRDTIKALGSAISNALRFAIYFIQEFSKLAIKVAGDVLNAFKPLLNFFSVILTKAINSVFGIVNGLIDNIKKALVFMGLLKDGEAEKNQKERFKKQKDFVKNLPNGVTAENIQYYTKDEIEDLRKQQTSPLNNMTSNSISNSKSSNNQTTRNINIDKIEVSTQATDVDSISNQIGASLQNQLKRTTATFEDGIEA